MSNIFDLIKNESTRLKKQQESYSEAIKKRKERRYRSEVFVHDRWLDKRKRRAKTDEQVNEIIQAEIEAYQNDYEKYHNDIKSVKHENI